MGVPAGNPSTAVRRSPSSRPKSRPFGAVSLETRLRARPLGREARREAPQPFDPMRRGSGERAHNVRPYKQYTDITGRYGGICGTGPAIWPSSPGGKSGEVGRAAAAVYEKAIDGGMLSGYLYPCKSNRRRVRSRAAKRRTGLLKVRRVLGFLGGSE